MNFYKNKRVFITGGHGFIGRVLVEMLKQAGAKVTAPKHRELELKSARAVVRAVSGHDLVFHLAAVVGGIHFNQIHPASLLRDNLLPTINVVEAARKAKVNRTLIVSSACVYPRFCTIPTPETDGFKAEPEPTNYGYGWSKRIAEILGKTYAQEYGMKIGLVRPYNAYGPGDNFDPARSHVIPALIKRVVDGENPLLVWGDGSASRSFIYVDDVVKGMMQALEKYPVPDPINLGTSEETKITDLVNLIVRLAGKKIKIQFDSGKPNGQPRRNCDVTKAKAILGFKAEIKLIQGLPEVIKYYRTHESKKS